MAARNRSGPTPLSRREKEIADLVAEGLTNKEIAGRLFISDRTVEGHVENILGKTGFDRRVQIVRWVAEQKAAATAASAAEPQPTLPLSTLPVQVTSFVGRERDL